MEGETKCFICGKKSDYLLPFVCKFCSHSFCIKHQLPENHKCESLEKWKRGELKKLKKPIRTITIEEPILLSDNWMERIKPKFGRVKSEPESPKSEPTIRININWIVLTIIIIIFGTYYAYSTGMISRFIEEYSGELKESTTTTTEITTTIETNYLALYFKDNLTNCNLDGKITYNNIDIGKTNDGLFNLSIQDFSKYYAVRDEICINGTLSECFEKNQNYLFYRCWYISFSSSDFDGQKLTFDTKIDTSTPYNIYEYPNYVTPDDVKPYIGNISSRFINDTESDLNSIWEYMNVRFSYNYDIEKESYQKTEKWQLPIETLYIRHGDCEDYSTALISLFRAYNESIDCYCVLLPSHLTNLCIIPETSQRWVYKFYDMEGTDASLIVSSGFTRTEKYTETKRLLNNYFKLYRISPENREILGIFNEKELKEFRDNDEFIDWLIEKK